MRKEERIAHIRVFTDMIMADTVIDAREMECLDELRAAYKFTQQEEIQAQGITLAEAIDTLRHSDWEMRQELIRHCRELSMSDKFCARIEALLIMSITKGLDDVWGEVSHIYSFPKSILNIPASCLIYIEGRHAESIDGVVERNYRALFSEFRLAGFEFVYIPRIVSHYRESDPELIDKIVRFVAPQLSPEGRSASIDKLLRMTTPEFTKDILCNKLGMDALRNTPPALFMKIGNSFVGETVYSNYLKMDVEGDLMRGVHGFLDEFTSMLSSDIAIVSNVKEQRHQFLYTGFYKMLLDAHLLRKHVRSRVFINPYKEEIFLPDIDATLSSLHRREKALYLTLLALSGRGGVNFSAPSNAREIETYRQHMGQVQALYGRIYGMFGGEEAKAPDLTQADIRRPMLSLIKRQLLKVADSLHNVGDYMVNKDADGSLFIHLDDDLVSIRDPHTGDMVALSEWIEKFS
ncbi:MAG: hypothetical protein LUD17_00575 [Bacteroidales bacterium]|nr:hypothetical protein [Bacteroidales bacterium]